MKLRYRQCLGKRVRAALFQQMEEEGLLPFAMSAWEKPTLKDWLALTATNSGAAVLLRCEAEAGRILGCGLFTRRPYRVWHFDFTAFRAGFSVAAQQARGGFAWMFRHRDCTSVMGVCPAPNRHAWRLAEACGFRILARLPEACFYARKGNYVDGVLVLCTREDLNTVMQRKKEVIMGFGGGGTPSIPEPTPVPKQEVQKPVTEAATAARQNQRDKAAKAAGIGRSIYTSPLNRADGNTRKTLLGQ